MNPILVRLFTAHPIARVQCARILAGDPNVRCVEESGFDVGIFDAGLSSLDAVVALASTRLPRMRSLLLSESVEEGICSRWLMRGFWGVVAYERYERELLAAVRHVAEGQLWFPPSVVARWMRTRTGAHPAGDPRCGTLTSREQEVVNLLREQLSNKEIATALRIGERTVKFHVSNILTKLALKSRHDVAFGLPAVKDVDRPIPPVP